MASYRVDVAAAAGALDARRFHAHNVALHAAVAGAVPLLGGHALGLPPLRAAVAGALFALHPVHAEAVGGLASRADLLCALAWVAGLAAYLRLLQKQRQPLAVGAASAAAALLRLTPVYILAAAAVAAKETGFTLFGALVAAEEFLLPAPPAWTTAATSRSASASPAVDAASTVASHSPSRCGGRAAAAALLTWVRGLAADVRYALTGDSTAAATAGAHPHHTGWRWRAARASTTAAVAASLLGARLALHGGTGLYPWSAMENQFARMPAGACRALSVAHTHAVYAALLAWPHRLAYHHGFPELSPLCTDAHLTAATAAALAADPRLWAVVATYAAAAAWLWRCMRARDRRALFVTTALLVAPFLPAANVAVWVGTEVAERLLYLPSLGWVLLAAGWWLPLSALVAAVPAWWAAAASSATALASGKRQPSPAPAGSRLRHRRAAAEAALLAALLGVNGWWTHVRLGDWADEGALFQRGVDAVSDPHHASVKALSNLGVHLLQQQSGTDSANSRDLVDRAEALLRRAVELFPGMAPARANLALVARARGDGRAAFRHAWDALSASAASGVPTSCRNDYELGRAYLEDMALADEAAHGSSSGSGGVDAGLPQWAVLAGGAAQAASVAAVLNGSTGSGGGGGERLPLALRLAAHHLDVALARGCVGADVHHSRGNARRHAGELGAAIREYGEAVGALGFIVAVDVEPMVIRRRPRRAQSAVTAAAAAADSSDGTVVTLPSVLAAALVPASAAPGAAAAPSDADNDEDLYDANGTPRFPFHAVVTLHRPSPAAVLAAQLAGARDGVAVDATAAVPLALLGGGPPPGSGDGGGLIPGEVEQLASTATMLALTLADDAAAEDAGVAGDGANRTDRARREAVARAWSALALRLRPGDAVFHANAATVLYRHGHAGGALRHARRAAALRPGDGLLQSNLGVLEEAAGGPDGAGDAGAALAAYTAAAAALPHHSQVAANLANLRARTARGADTSNGSG